MKLVSYLDGNGAKPGAVTDTGVVDLSGRFASLLELIGEGDAALEEARSVAESGRPAAQLSEVELTSPIPSPRRNIFCMGWNYLTHFEEGRGKRGDQERELPEYPTFFDKVTTTINGPYDAVPIDPDLSEKMDFEAELAVIIGPGGRSISADNALDHVFGYTAANDVSARDIQRRHGGQWLKGKGVDGSCPLGPWIVTSDEIPDPQNLDVQCHVNGVEKQSSNTRFMIFPVRRLIEELSLAMTLLPGDILLTGTPEGVGFGRDPQEFLQPDDEMRVTISGVGEISNRVEQRSLTRQESPHVA